MSVFAVNDLVWAKMKGFSPWPGRVVQPPIELKKTPKKNVPVKCIFFFGSNNYAWIEDTNIKAYLPFKDSLSKASKSAAFKEACEKIEEYLENPNKFLERMDDHRDVDAEFNKLRELDPSDTLDTSNNSVFDSADGALDSTSMDDVDSPPSPGVSPLLPTPKRVPKKKAAVPYHVEKFHKSKVFATKNKAEASPVNDKDMPVQKRKRLYSGEYSFGNGAAPARTASISMVDDAAADESASEPTPIPESAPDPAPIRDVADIEDVPQLEEVELDIATISDTLRSKNIVPSTRKFGVLGLGIMGSGIVKNLLNSGHNVYVWNRTYTKCRKFTEAGATACVTPSDVVDNADIVFSCVADPDVAKEMVFGNCGVLQSERVGDNRGYVEMTGIDAETSQDIAEAIVGRGGRYLEAQIQGSKKQSADGTLIILAAGDRSLFEQCQTCFEAMGKNSFYLGEVGNASRMNLVLQLLSGIQIAALAEAMALAERANLQQKDVLEVLELTHMASPHMMEKGRAIIRNQHPTNLALKHLQKDLKLALGMSDALDQPLPLTASANEVFKHAKRLGYGSHDASAVYKMHRFWRGL